MRDPRAICGFIAIALAGCTTAMYEGAPRPDNETATIESAGTFVDAIDGQDANAFSNGGNHAKYKILPGEHAIDVGLNDSGHGMRKGSKVSLRIYLNAQAGHVYTTKPSYAGRLWRPQIIDESTGASVGYFRSRQVDS